MRIISLLLVLLFGGEVWAQSFCVSCLKIRVGRPLISRGPTAVGIDNAFNEIQKAGGGYRGFTANGTTYSLDGPDPWSMGGPETVVLSPGLGSPDACGRWINDTQKVGSTIRGFVHNEHHQDGSCGSPYNHHKSMSYYTSANEGLSWTNGGIFLDFFNSPPTPTIQTGDGDGTVVDGGDGYLYAYTRRHGPLVWHTFVARALASNPIPGNWFKWFSGSWSQPGVGGNASSLGPHGMAASRWLLNNNIMLLGMEDATVFGGMRMSFSSNKTSFTSVNEPLLRVDGYEWVRPASTELIGYPSTIDYDGDDLWNGGFLLSHLYIQPTEDFDKRYLVFRDVTVTLMGSTQSPQVGVALARWYNAAQHDRWSTTAPVPGNYVPYAFEGTFGYLMTKPHSTKPTTKLEDCVSNWPGHPDHLLTNDGMCAPSGYTRLRTAGWVFQNSEPNTVPVYRCYSPTLHSHFASNQSNCEGLGNMEWLLGYALAN